jgi:hypothetical protein
VQVPFEPGRNRVLKVAYDVDQPWDEPVPRIILGRMLRGLGALPRLRTFQELNIGQGLGHHIEVVAPEDTEIIAARLRGTQWSTVEHEEQLLAGDAQVRSRSRSHAYVRLSAGDEGAADPDALRDKRLLGRGDRAEFTVAIAPRRSGVIAVATITAAFTAVTMTVFATRLADLDGQTSAAVLLLVPVIFAAYVSRPGEHPFATRALIGVRTWALIGGGLAAILSAMIGAGFMKPEPSAAPKPRASVQELRCRTTAARARATASRRSPASRALCTLRSHSPAAASSRPAGRAEVDPLVAFVSWTLAASSGGVALVMFMGYVVAASVRRGRERLMPPTRPDDGLH